MLLVLPRPCMLTAIDVRLVDRWKIRIAFAVMRLRARKRDLTTVPLGALESG